jgi:hypothetical protein
MSMFRKKPVIIEARQWSGGVEAATPIIQWILDGDGTARWHEKSFAGTQRIEGVVSDYYRSEHVAIDTLEGVMKALPGDWIIRGVQGEFYPCKPDIFDATYEPIDLSPGEGDEHGRHQEPVNDDRG